MSNAATIIRTIRTAVLAAVVAVAGFMLVAVPAEAALTPLQFEAVEAGAYNADGTQFTQAGGVPHRITAGFEVTTRLVPLNPLTTNRIANALVRDIHTDAPAGLIVDPTAVPRCPREYLGDNDANRFGTDNFCPVASQVGVIEVDFSGPSTGQRSFYPLFNIEPRKGDAADFAFKIPQPTHDTSHIVGSILTGSYRPRASALAIPYIKAINRVRVHLWGNPSDPSHDRERGITCDRAVGGDVGECLHSDEGVSSPGNAALLRIQPRCGGTGEITTISGRSWHVLDMWDTKEAISPPATGCSSVPFDAQSSVAVDDPRPGVPAAAKIGLTVPYSEDPTRLSHAQIDDVVVDLPEGMRLNPASAHGLAACTEAQFDEMNPGKSACPDAAVVGSVDAESPALDHAVKGRLFLAEPYANRFGGLVALYLVVHDEESGVTVKAAGKVDLDPVTGKIRATFQNNPQLPVTRLDVTTNGGQRAALVTPETCGHHTSTVGVTSWAGHNVSQTPLLPIFGCGLRGGFRPGLATGTSDPVAGASSPFVLTVARHDGHQEVKAVRTVTLPEGLLGRVGDVPLCGEAQAATGTCPEASRIGHVQASSGAGSSPLWIPQPGKAATGVYLTGPYKGGPYGLSIKVPAQAGPFDLGTIVVRGALHVDSRDAHVTVVTDDLPTILKGVPLQIREMRVIMDRPGFMRNPTSCAEKKITASIWSVHNVESVPGSRFQVGECASLKLDPKIDMDLEGKKETRRGKHPALSTTLTQKDGESALRKVRVRLPLSLALDPDNAKALCKPEQAAAKACPADSVVGQATAVSPILKQPLRGDVFFVEGTRSSHSLLLEIFTQSGIGTEIR